jgi:asparagine synthase (glutamine-hydrolysing)
MCGFVTVFNPRTSPNLSIKEMGQMCDLIENRGPDNYGLFEDEHIITGCRRLSIIDLSNSANLPFSKNNYTISYNGEIYNYIEIREKLVNEYGIKFHTNSDTEVVLEAYINYGPNCLTNFNGMFAFTIWDEKNKSLFVARDRLGVKPLFYSEMNGDYYFASDIKSLWVKINPSGLLNDSAIYNYFGQGYISETTTTTKTIKKFPPGHHQTINNLNNEFIKYWDITFNDEINQMNFHDSVIETEKILEDAVKIRLRSDVSLGTFLSGGIDSTIVTGITKKFIQNDLNTFAIGFNSNQFDESKYANSVAANLGTNHTLKTLDITALNQLPMIVWQYSELFADSSSIPTYWVSNLASKSLKVVLTGDGADEAFGGYLDPFVVYNSERYLKAPKIIRQALNNIFMNEIRFPGFLSRIKKFIKISNSDLIDAYMLFRDGSWYGYGDCLINNNFSIKESLSYYLNECDSTDKIRKLIYSDLKDRLYNDFLFKVDMGTMAHSIEARSPFLDYRLIEFGISMSHDTRYYKNKRKAVLKKIAEKYMKRKYINRRKMGFSIPKHAWLSDDKYWGKIKNIINRKSSLNNYVYPMKIDKILSEFEYGNSAHANRIWQLLIFQIWDGLFISKINSPEEYLLDIQ